MATSYVSMEIVALSKSLGNDIYAYLQTRLLLPRIVALGTLVLLAAWCHSLPPVCRSSLAPCSCLATS